jgi:hypothetical protein
MYSKLRLAKYPRDGTLDERPTLHCSCFSSSVSLPILEESQAPINHFGENVVKTGLLGGSLENQNLVHDASSGGDKINNHSVMKVS